MTSLLPGCAALASCEARLRPFLVRLPPAVALRIYSRGRRIFLERFAGERPEARSVPSELSRTLWGLRFRSSLFNAAGMFKQGDGYAVVARQGAGAWLCGTTTHRPRRGNRRRGVRLPFAPYPASGAASNWLGLPNPGHEAVARRIADLGRVDGCPVGASLALDPGAESEDAALEELVRGLELFAEAGVDFLEINESCPNTGEQRTDEEEELRRLRRRLEMLRDAFLERRGSSVPVIVKLGVESDPAVVPELVATLRRLGFAGVNFGNTATSYDEIRGEVEPTERRLYDAFVERFGGGVSGRPLRSKSLRLVEIASRAAGNSDEGGEFHVIRTGGVETAADVAASSEAGASLCQWYTGYFEAFARDGHDVYRRIYEDLRESRLHPAASPEGAVQT